MNMGDLSDLEADIRARGYTSEDIQFILRFVAHEQAKGRLPTEDQLVAALGVKR